MKRKDLNIMLIIILMKLVQTIVYVLAKLTPYTPRLLHSALDDKIPFVSHFIYFYVSWYAMIIIIPFIIYKKDVECFKRHAVSYVLSIFISFFIFFFYPTTVTRPEIMTNTLSDRFTKILYHTDNPPLNCLPSMHCALCFFLMFYITKCKNMKNSLKISIIFLDVLVILSTLFLKQHVLIDVIFAFLFSIIIYNISEIIIKKDKVLERNYNSFL